MPNNAMARVIVAKHIYPVAPCVPSWPPVRKDTMRASQYTGEFLTRSDKINRFDNKEILDVMDPH
jgi:hypothetical protein